MFRSRSVFTGAESQTFLAARLHKTSAAVRGMIVVGGRTSTDLGFLTAGLGGDPSLYYYLSELPVPQTSIAADTTWGNATITTRVTNARTYAQASLGFASGKVILQGSSMGALGALNWAKANPTLVEKIVLFVPAVNLGYMYANNVGGWAAEMSTAHGGDPPSSADPLQNTASFTSIPIKVWYSTDDPYVRPQDVTDFATAVGGTAVSLGAHSHTIAGINYSEVAAFVTA